MLQVPEGSLCLLVILSAANGDGQMRTLFW